MVEQDTIRLLRECDAGVKMGTEAIDEVIGYVCSNELKNALLRNRSEHGELDAKLRELLVSYGDSGKQPSPIAKGMSWVKTNVKLAINDSDKTIAELITDGCNMGMKSLKAYLNEFKAADEESKDIAKKLIKLEEKLSDSVSAYL